MKKAVKAFVFISAMLFPLISAAQEHSVEKISIKAVMGEGMEKQAEMLLMDKMGYLKAEDAAIIFGAELSSGKREGEIMLDLPRGKASFEVGKQVVVVNWVPRKMNKSPVMYENEIWLPLEAMITSAFMDTIGKTVTWNYSIKTLNISERAAGTQGQQKKITNITGIKIYSHSNYSRLSVILSEDLPYKATKTEDDKLVLQVDGGSIDIKAGSIEAGDNLIEKVGSRQETDYATIVIKLGKSAGGYIVKKLSDPTFRIIVDVTKKDDKTPASQAPSGEQARKKIKTIVIDPGHGGKDPGAIGTNGLKEKDINLKISLQLARLLSRNLNMKVIMTRVSDIFIPLAQRTLIANQKNADIFVSVHCNASLKKNTKGFEVYFLSERATDDEAQAVANIENSVLEMENNANIPDQVGTILKGMLLSKFMNASSELCSFVSKSVKQNGRVENRGVKQAGFFVMRDAQMPAILVECAFLSNTGEERKLSSSWFQNHMAKSVYGGLKSYIEWMEKKK